MLDKRGTIVIMTIEEALDWFRAEGGWEPQGSASAHPSPPPGPVPGPGKFVNRCDRCLTYTQAARVKVGWPMQQVWLCDPCGGPNPPVMVPIISDTFAGFMREERARLKAIEKERKKREREEAKARLAAVRGVRGRGVQTRKPKDVVPQAPEGPAVSV